MEVADLGISSILLIMHQFWEDRNTSFLLTARENVENRKGGGLGVRLGPAGLSHLL